MTVYLVLNLGTPRRRRFAGAERGSRVLQRALNPRCDRVRAAEYLARGSYRVLERRHCFAQIVERCAGVMVERLRVIIPHPEREIVTLSKNAPDNGCSFAQQCLGFFEALVMNKGRRVVVGCNESLFMFFAKELQTSGVNVSLNQNGLVKPSQCLIRNREIALQQPATTRRPLFILIVSKKPNHCCAKRFLWRGASSARVMRPHSRRGGFTRSRSTMMTAPRSTISARQ